MQVHQPTTPLDEAPIFAPPTNAPASPIPLKQMIQRSDGRNCYPENRSLGARMASLLLPLVYLVSHSTLRSPPVLAVPPLLPDSPTDLHFPDVSKQAPALGSEKSSRNPLTGVGIHIGSEVCHRKPWSGALSGLRESGNGWGKLNRGTWNRIPARVDAAARTESPHGSGTAWAVPVVERPFRVPGLTRALSPRRTLCFDSNPRRSECLIRYAVLAQGVLGG